MTDGIQHQAAETARTLLDGVSYGTVVGTLLGFLPSIAAGFSIVWICYQLYHAEKNRRRAERERKEKK